MAYRCPVTDMVVNDDEVIKAPNPEMQELSDRLRYKEEHAVYRTRKDGGTLVYPCNHPGLFEEQKKKQGVSSDVVQLSEPKPVN